MTVAGNTDSRKERRPSTHTRISRYCPEAYVAPIPCTYFYEGSGQQTEDFCPRYLRVVLDLLKTPDDPVVMLLVRVSGGGGYVEPGWFSRLGQKDCWRALSTADLGRPSTRLRSHKKVGALLTESKHGA